MKALHVTGFKQLRLVLAATSFVAASLLGAATAAAQTPAEDVTDLSMQDLLDVEVVSTASKFPQSIREAPASITVITAEDIRRFGYRTLAEALKSVRGFYTTYDRNYTYVGMRGFARPGDYNTRMLLLIDGQRLNDAIYDMAPVGTDLPIPMSLIERIEIIRGPGSSLYGSNALFGVVNVLTKTGGARKGVQVEGQGGSLGTHAGMASYGRLFSNGSEILMAASGYRSNGQNRIRFPEFAGDDGTAGIAVSMDRDDVSTFLASASAGRFSLRATAVKRYKQVPTASFGTVFGDPREATTDTRGSVSGVYDGPLGRGWMGTGRLAYDYYGYRGDYPYDYGDDGLVVFEDLASAHSLTGEITARRSGRIHQFTLGAEVRHHFQARQAASDVLSQYLDLDMPGTNVGVYVQDEIRLRPWLLLNAGARIDQFVDFGTHATPRAAVVLLPRSGTAVKLLYGSAFRAPNVYERYYYNHAAGLSDQLEPEQIRSTELVWEELISANVKASVSAFIYDVDRIIEQRLSTDVDTLDDVYFANVGGTRAHGIEAEAEARLDAGVVARVSHSFTRARDRATARPISNSPAHLSKASVQFPLFGAAVVAVDGQYVGERLTLGGEALEGFFTSNVSVSTAADRRLTIGVTAYNLFNRNYADPGAEEHVQSAIRQDGRTFLVRAGVRF